MKKKKTQGHLRVQSFNNEGVFILTVFPDKLIKCIRQDFLIPDQLSLARIK